MVLNRPTLSQLQKPKEPQVTSKASVNASTTPLTQFANEGNMSQWQPTSQQAQPSAIFQPTPNPFRPTNNRSMGAFTDQTQFNGGTDNFQSDLLSQPEDVGAAQQDVDQRQQLLSSLLKNFELQKRGVVDQNVQQPSIPQQSQSLGWMGNNERKWNAPVFLDKNVVENDVRGQGTSNNPFNGMGLGQAQPMPMPIGNGMPQPQPMPMPSGMPMPQPRPMPMPNGMPMPQPQPMPMPMPNGMPMPMPNGNGMMQGLGGGLPQLPNMQLGGGFLNQPQQQGINLDEMMNQFRRFR